MSRNRFYVKNTLNRDGRATVILSVCVNHTRLRLGTGVTVKLEDWNALKQEVKRSDPQYAHLNTKLRERITEVEKVIADRMQVVKGKLNLRDLLSDLTRRPDPEAVVIKEVEAPETMWEAYSRFIAVKRTSVAPRTVAKYETLLSLLKEFTKRKGLIDYANITHDFGDAFTKFLLTKKAHTNNTVGKYISTFKTFLSWADERGAVIPRDYVKFRVPEEDVEVVALTAEELQMIVDFDLTQNDRLQRVRDLFLFACYTGARFSDVQSFNVDDVRDNVWHLRMNKTKTVIRLNLNQHARRILKSYMDDGKGLPKISSQKMNDYLKELGKAVGLNEPVRIVRYRGSEKVEDRGAKWEFLSSHVARRTFVTLSLERGMRPEILMTFTGHTSHKTMKRYIALTETKRKEEMEKVWG